MKLSSNVSIVFAGQVITESALEKFRAGQVNSKGQCLANPTSLPGKFSDTEIFLYQLTSLVPFLISGRDSEILVFDGYVKRFMYSINGTEGFSRFSLRLVLRKGKLGCFKLLDDKEDPRVIRNINEFELRDGNIHAEFGNHQLRFELYLGTDAKDLGKLLPPMGYMEKVVTR